MSAPARVVNFPGLIGYPPESNEPREISYNELIMSFHAGKPYFAFYTHVPEFEAEAIKRRIIERPVEHSCCYCLTTTDAPALMVAQAHVVCPSCWAAIQSVPR
jgi:hypothetical protein